MLQLARRSRLSRFDDAERAALRAHFDTHLWARLPGVLAPSLLEEIQKHVAAGTFVAHQHPDVTPPSADLAMRPNAASALLEFLLNDPDVYRDMEAITGSDPISHFVGWVYRMVPEIGHHHHWHNDLINDRMLALSVTLGPEDYEGGVLELRDRASERVLDAVPNPRPGDAVVFALDPALQHRVTCVTRGAKTAFVGWFCDGSSYFDLLRSAALP